MPDDKDYDIVSKAKHYNCMGEKDKDGRSVYEPVKVIESWGLAEGFYLGSALKYILRAKHKGNERQDLEKALWYLERLVQNTWELMSFVIRGLESQAVAEAWGLSEELTAAVAAIHLGSPGLAAHHVALELSALKMAEEIKEEEDERVLDEIVSVMTKRAASFVQKHPPKPLGELAKEQDSLVKISNKMKSISHKNKGKGFDDAESD